MLRRFGYGMCCVVCVLAAGAVAVQAHAQAGLPPVKETLTDSTVTTHRPDSAYLATLPIVWTSKAEASSAYSSDGWAAKQLIGPPDVYPAFGDIPQAWASQGSDDSLEWAIVRFAKPTPMQAALIFETLNTGAIVRIDDMTNPKKPVALWSGTTRRGGMKSRVMFLALAAPRSVTALRLVVDSPAVPGWNEIDAVGLVGTIPDLGPDEFTFGVKPFPSYVEGATLTVEAPLAASLKSLARWGQQLVETSGERGNPGYGGIQALAAPDTYPDAGDIDRAWNPDNMDEGGASITLRFHPTNTRQVLIVTNANGGAIAQIDDLTDPKNPTTLWYGKRDTLTAGSQVLTLTLPSSRKIDTLRVSLDTARTPGWEAIDAIGLAP